MGAFKITKLVAKNNSPFSQKIPEKPKLGDIIYPDRPYRNIYHEASSTNASYRVAYINAEGKALTRKNNQVATIVCFVNSIPVLGQVIVITRVNNKSVEGRMEFPKNNK
jgi:hypothetical protein